MTNNDLINITQKTKDQATRTQLKPGMNAGSVAGETGHAPQVTPTVLPLMETQ